MEGRRMMVINEPTVTHNRLSWAERRETTIWWTDSSGPHKGNEIWSWREIRNSRDDPIVLGQWPGRGISTAAVPSSFVGWFPESCACPRPSSSLPATTVLLLVVVVVEVVLCLAAAKTQTADTEGRVDVFQGGNPSLLADSLQKEGSTARICLSQLFVHLVDCVSEGDLRNTNAQATKKKGGDVLTRPFPKGCQRCYS